jgi:nitrogen fixation-related uncharacterized protein
MILSDGMTPLFVVWITYTALALAGASAIIVWAVRNRQFSDQDRARYLALGCGPVEKKEEKSSP